MNPTRPPKREAIRLLRLAMHLVQEGDKGGAAQTARRAADLLDTIEDSDNREEPETLVASGPSWSVQ